MADINRTMGAGIVALVLVIGILFSPAFCGTRKEVTYFQNSDYETHVFILKGERPGHTVLIVSGLHGDESGGFLAAEAFTRVDVKNGKLIIIPRANLPAIQLKRRYVNVDMNRRFFLEASFADSNFYEDKVVAIIKKYIKQSDAVLDLHCGSGFYRPRYINRLENPRRWGQSIIADDDKVYFKGKKEVSLRAIAEQVIPYLNSMVRYPKYHYHFNNTRTKYPDSIHPEQRVSLSFYSLYGANVIAFGLETSKALPLDYYKAYYHICAVKRFLDLFGVTYTGNPRPLFHPPRLRYLLCSIDGHLTCVRNGDMVGVPYGARLKVEMVVARFGYPSVVDIPDVEGINDRGKEVIINSKKKVFVRKDGRIYASIRVVPLPGFKEDIGLIIKINGEQRRISIGGTIYMTSKDRLCLCDVFGINKKDVKVNLLGFAPPGRRNRGEDRGVLICPEKARLIRRYAMIEQGSNVYPINLTDKKYLLGTVFLKIVSSSCFASHT